ncbi:hypothetical protein Mal4_35410 [Maioricimonas rarisocia]|uniref:GmrSD restriction endonucleases N-terminal domain-containing protein n=1 Tax=Maioricimonas rarisocia TaxID=2528026 RepID=A0A517Z9N7_9PLAN|nr:DUF262 domain-containing protein [Maioricimonas rarisocia]QDU39204.1 hypothetical protein Mal4_35410 [Maioricimonas rarisocia]
MSAITSTFKSSEPSLPNLLKDIDCGEIQLPDFQRGWVWDDDHIRSLIASISLSYPVGAIMLLQTGGDGVQFQPRPVQGVRLEHKVRPDFLILDGQQRMTSLYLALQSGQPVPTRTARKQEIERVYYLDIAKCLDPTVDRIEAVISLPADRKLTSDFGRKVELDVSTTEKEYEQGLFPLHSLFDHSLYFKWRHGFESKFMSQPENLQQLQQFETGVISRFQNYRIPAIELLRDTPKEAVCQVFEKVNTGGVTLTVFELVTAIFAADNFQLRKDWEARSRRLRKQSVLRSFEETSFLTAVTLLTTFERHRDKPSEAVTCKRRDVLKLTLADYSKYAERIEKGLDLAARFLAREGVFDTKSLPYSTQLVPLSAICAFLEDRFEQDPVRQKLAQWYWCGVFGELYGGANESRFAFDVPGVVAWIEGGEVPRTVSDAGFSPTRLLSMQTRNSAAYKGLMALLMRSGSHDFVSGDSIALSSYFDLSIDIHHIFPRAYCEKRNYKKNLWNSSVNKAPLSAKTNRAVGGKAPSEYLAAIEKNYKMESARLDEIIDSHAIDPLLLRSDRFDDFIQDRAIRLLDLIEQAMGKAVSGRDANETINAFGGPLQKQEVI